jgi:hypothetical protein
MTRVGWLVDVPTVPGGAELTEGEFRAAAPNGVEIVPCPPGEPVPGCDRYVIHNLMQYALLDLATIPPGAPVVKYNHDVGPWLEDGVRDWLDKNATQVCCSPIQAEHMGLDGAFCIPPPVDLDRFAEAATRVNGDRSGVVSVGSWRNHGKAPHKAAEYAPNVDFFGDGPFAPPGTVTVPYEAMPDLLASYAMFVFLPTVLEPFGRTVAEAWAAGCQVVTNGLVGAGWWIEHNPAAITPAGADFWRMVLDA